MRKKSWKEHVIISAPWPLYVSLLLRILSVALRLINFIANLCTEQMNKFMQCLGKKI